MGAHQSRECDLESSDSDSDYEESEEMQQQSSSKSDCKEIQDKFETLSINGPAKAFAKDGGDGKTLVKLYLHVGGNTPAAKWAVADKLVPCEFIRDGEESDGDSEASSEEDEDEGEKYSIRKGKSKNNKAFRTWILKIGDKIRARVDDRLQIRSFDDQMRVDFVNRGVWAMKFPVSAQYKQFLADFQNCMFENTYLMQATEENKVKVFGKDFLGWANPKQADESVWEMEEDGWGNSEGGENSADIKEQCEEEALEDGGGIQSLAMGALDYSFLVSGSGVEAVKNMQQGIHGKGMTVAFKDPKLATCTPKKAMLMKAESNMLLMSPAKEGRPHSTALHQFDVETGKVVSEWRFEKDGTPITMRDVTNDSKGSQLDPTESTFLGLDDSRLCRWDMRVRYGNVQQIDSNSPVLTWAEGHQFSKGTNFQCFASAGDGSIVVGSVDGKIRLYGKTSMRMAKTAFPGLGSPITHVDVTFDGKWVLGTTDSYLILISTLFTDRDGKLKTGFTGRMGNKIAAPRLLKLTPLHSHLAGPDSKFQGGKFSWITESGRQEQHLVATVGNCTVVWNFKQVKNSSHECYKHQEGLKSCYCYKIVPKDESIVDSSFMHDKFALTENPEAPLVVVTPKNVSSFSIGR